MVAANTILPILPIVILLAIALLIALKPAEKKDRVTHKNTIVQTNAIYMHHKKQQNTSPPNSYLRFSEAAFSLALLESDMPKKLRLIEEGNKAFEEAIKLIPAPPPMMLFEWSLALLSCLKNCPENAWLPYCPLIQNNLGAAAYASDSATKVVLAEGWLKALADSAEKIPLAYKKNIFALALNLFKEIKQEIPSAQLHKKLVTACSKLQSSID